MKRTMTVIRTLVQAAGLTALAMATLASLVFLLYCLAALVGLTVWGTVIPVGVMLYMAFCVVLFALQSEATTRATGAQRACRTPVTGVPPANVGTLPEIVVRAIPRRSDIDAGAPEDGRSPAAVEHGDSGAADGRPSQDVVVRAATTRAV